MIYNEQSYLTLRVNAGIDLSGATVHQILYKKPDGTKGEWNATIDGQTLVYSLANDDLDQNGNWEFQAYIEVGGKKGFGNTAKQVIEKNIS